MSEKILIDRKDYECLRRCLSEAFKVFESLGVRELKNTPKMTPQQERKNKYKTKLEKTHGSNNF